MKTKDIAEVEAEVKAGIVKGITVIGRKNDPARSIDISSDLDQDRGTAKSKGQERETDKNKNKDIM